MPMTLAGGTDYVVRAAVVFYATGPNGAPIQDVTLHFPLAGHRLTAKLTLVETDWSWGDGTSTKVTTGSLVGRPYTDAVPCESATVCSSYIAHVFTKPGRRAISVQARWDVKVTVDATGEPIPVTGGAVHRIDTAGKAIIVHRARVVLVGNQ